MAKQQKAKGAARKTGRSKRGAYPAKVARHRAVSAKRKRRNVMRSLGLLGKRMQHPEREAAKRHLLDLWDQARFDRSLRVAA